MNRGTWNEKEEFPGLDQLAASLLPENIIQMEEAFYQTKVQPKFFYLQPDELWKWKVDTLCYMRNNYCEDYRPLIIAACADEHEKVREMAALICEELRLVRQLLAVSHEKQELLALNGRGFKRKQKVGKYGERTWIKELCLQKSAHDHKSDYTVL